jgi:hypothetical protein
MNRAKDEPRPEGQDWPQTKTGIFVPPHMVAADTDKPGSTRARPFFTDPKESRLGLALSFFTFFVAIAAAIFTFGQWNEARNATKAAGASATAAVESLAITKRGLVAEFQIMARQVGIAASDSEMQDGISISALNIGHSKARAVSLTTRIKFFSIIGNRPVGRDFSNSWPSLDVLPNASSSDYALSLKKWMGLKSSELIERRWRNMYVVVESTVSYEDGFGHLQTDRDCEVLIGHATGPQSVMAEPVMCGNLVDKQIAKMRKALLAGTIAQW